MVCMSLQKGRMIIRESLMVVRCRQKNPSECHCLASQGFVVLFQTVIPKDRFFYLHQTAMIDSLSCIPFDLQYLILT